MGHLKHTIHIEAPVERVWRFTDDPRNWPAFMAGVSYPKKTVGDVGVGTSLELTALVGNWQLQEIVRTVEDLGYPDGGGHWRCEFAGSSAGWLTMDCTPEEGGTLVTEEMEYTVPGVASGELVDRTAFESSQDEDMRRSLENLKLLMERSPAGACTWCSLQKTARCSTTTPST